jgi:hypothetical protein
MGPGEGAWSGVRRFGPLTRRGVGTSQTTRARCDARGSSSRALCSNEEEPRDARHPPRRHRVGPPPVVRFSLARLGHLRLPAVLGKEGLRVVGAEAARSAATGEGLQQWPHYRGAQESSVDEVRAELAAGCR